MDGGIWRIIRIVMRIRSIWIGWISYGSDRIGSDRTRALSAGSRISDIWIVPKGSWMDKLDKMTHTFWNFVFGFTDLWVWITNYCKITFECTLGTVEC